MRFPWRDQTESLPQTAPQTVPLVDSVRMLIRRDFELSDMNDRYNRQLVEFSVMQEAILLANQIKDRRQMFSKVGELLMSHLNYDRYFVIEQYEDAYKPLTALGFDERPFEAKFQLLQTSGLLPRLFKDQPFWLFQPAADEISNQIISILNASSVAIVHLQTRRFRALLGVAMNQPLNKLSKEDINFLILLVSQLNVIVDNIDSYNQLAQQNEELRQLDKAKTTFLSIASHQLRTPLSVMRFAISFLRKEQTGQLNPKQKELVDEMSKSNTRIIGLVEDLLNITRIEQGRLQLKVESITLSTTVNAILSELKEKIAEKQIKIQLNIPQILMFDGDSTLIRESMMNLITNGIKYNQTGGVLAIGATNNGTQVTITVSDTGIGISPADQQRLFTQFFRSQEAQSIDPEGVGLGLYTTRQFIRMHGGQITVQSVPGKGTTFAITLPIHQPKPAVPVAMPLQQLPKLPGQ